MEFLANQQNCKHIFRTDVFANLDSNVQNKDELLFKHLCQFHFSLRRLTRHSQLSNGIAWRQLRRSLPKPDKKCMEYGRNSSTAFSTAWCGAHTAVPSAGCDCHSTTWCGANTAIPSAGCDYHSTTWCGANTAVPSAGCDCHSTTWCGANTAVPSAGCCCAALRGYPTKGLVANTRWQNDRRWNRLVDKLADGQTESLTYRKA